MAAAPRRHLVVGALVMSAGEFASAMVWLPACALVVGGLLLQPEMLKAHVVPAATLVVLTVFASKLLHDLRWKILARLDVLPWNPAPTRAVVGFWLLLHARDSVPAETIWQVAWISVAAMWLFVEIPVALLRSSTNRYVPLWGQMLGIAVVMAAAGVVWSRVAPGSIELIDGRAIDPSAALRYASVMTFTLLVTPLAVWSWFRAFWRDTAPSNSSMPGVRRAVSARHLHQE